MNLWRITWTYSNRADHVQVETAGYANWLHEKLRDHNSRQHYASFATLTVTAVPVSGFGQGWEWINPEADYAPAHARNSVDAGAQGV
jgi:hypothetical protein